MSRAAKLLQQAQAATSLDDFGENSFLEGLEILVASVDAEARLNGGGRAGFDLQLIDLLCNRLQVEYWYRLHPEIEEQEIVAPLIGLGLPRTGSTALSCLLAEDPAVRSIRNWEAQAPCPPPETATEYSDPRIAKAQQSMDRRNVLFPRMKMMVPSTATSPTECQTYMAFDFKSQLFQAFVQVPTYVEWLNHKADLVPTYRYVKRVLKLLQWRCPPTRWRLKNPSHCLFIDALADVFPDARFWMTHRDIANVIPSVADLYYELTKAFSDDVDKLALGKMTTDFCELGMRRMMAFRDAGNDHRFFDIYFAPFQKDPFPFLAQLYGFLGEELTPQALQRMAAWRRNTPRDKHGSHQCDPADFGLDPAQLRKRFAFYSERYTESWRHEQAQTHNCGETEMTRETEKLSGGLAPVKDMVLAGRPDHPEMRESVSIWMFEENGAFAFPRMGIEAESASWANRRLQGNFSFADGRVLNGAGVGPAPSAIDADGRPTIIGAGALTFRCIEPFRRWSVTFNGPVVDGSITEQIEGKLKTRKPSTPVRLQAEMTMVTPAWVQEFFADIANMSEKDAANAQAMGLGYRIEHHFRAQGILEIDGRKRDFNATGTRIHRQSIRRLDGFAGHCWLSAVFPDGRAFGCLVYPPLPDGTERYNDAVIYQDGRLIPARVVKTPFLRRIVFAGDDVSVELESELGLTRITGITALSTFRVGNPDIGGLNLQQGGALYTWDDQSAYGMVERSSHESLTTIG